MRKQRFRPGHRFWLINLALLVLFGWTLTEESSLVIRVAGGQCTAVFPDRTSSIPCPELGEGFVGLFLSDVNTLRPFDLGPLDWAAPRSAWRQFRLSFPDDNERPIELLPAQDVAGWRHVIDEWRPIWKSAVMRWKLPLSGDLTLDARLRRPDEEAGILLLDSSGEQGRAFIISPRNRRGVWWQWRDGQPSEPIVGMPFQKSFLSQGQSLLRRVLRAHQGALLLLLAGWLVREAAKWFGRHQPLPLPRGIGLERHPFVRGKLLAAALTLLVFLFGLFFAGDVLGGIPHVQDSITYLFQAQTLADGHLWAPAPPLPAFFEQEFMLIENGRWFGKYSPGFPLVLAIGVLLKIPWLINPLLAALTIPLLYALGKSLYGRSTGILAALLALASPFFLFMSGSMMAHPAELFWMTFFMLGWARSMKEVRSRRWILVAGLALGMAYLTRAYTTVAVGIPFVAVSLLAQLRFLGRQVLPPLVRKASFLLALLSPFVLLLFAYQWAISGDPFDDPRLGYWSFDRPGFGQDIGMDTNAFTLTEIEGEPAVSWFFDPAQPPRGHTPARGLYNTEQNWRSLESQLFGWPIILTFAFCWLAFLVGRPSWRDVMLLATAGGLVGLYIFYWSSGIMYGPRYYYAALPAFFLLTARGIQATAVWLGGRQGRNAVAVLTMALILGNMLFYLPKALEGYHDYNFVSGEKAAFVEENIKGNGIVFVTTEGYDWWDYGGFFSGNTPWLDGRIIYARDLGEEENSRLLSLYPSYEIYYWKYNQLLSTAGEQRSNSGQPVPGGP